jgi:predicted pyridoxine 5'-phosphate oxidase superfamily flavin-nucleotide-binding protein
MTFHQGEIAVQSRAGVRMMAERVGRGIHVTMPPIAQNFLSQQTLAVASTIDSNGDVWASLLTGSPGFLNPLGDKTLQINALPADSDPLPHNLAANPHLGLVAIDFASRSRVRINGRAQLQESGLLLQVDQAYSNCPKYIQARAHQPAPRISQSEAIRSNHLTDSESALITRADTFFIASYHPESGADASHRGGNPGFVHVVDQGVLEFPDYSGNMMFNTLGNLTAYPRAGLLFLDFDRGSLLQLTGQIEIAWETDRLTKFAGAERLITLHIKQVIEHPNALPFHFMQPNYSPYNPT